MLVDLLLNGAHLDLFAYLQQAGTKRREAIQRRKENEEDALEALLLLAPPAQKRRLERLRTAGPWLSTMPSLLNGTVLSAEEFRDSLRLRYGFQPGHLQSHCDGCQQRNSVEHALSCKKGGLIRLRHNELMAEWHQLCATAFSPTAVTDEPLIHTGQLPQEEGGAGGQSQLPPDIRGDVAVRGFWKRSSTAIFDVRVVDTDAPSYRGQDPTKILANHEKRKKTNTSSHAWLVVVSSPLSCSRWMG